MFELTLDLKNLWATIRSHAIRPPALRGSPPVTEDDADTLVLEQDAEAPALQHITGILLEIEYRDSRNQISSRRVTCRRLERYKDRDYLFAYCHERQNVRRFRRDRIAMVIDPETGEFWKGQHEFFSRYEVAHNSDATLTWNMPLPKYMDMRTALVALAFMARCDQEWHPLETEEVERFITSFWIREEIDGDPPIADILRDTMRLAPTPEDFFSALIRCKEKPRLASLLRHSIAALIDADEEIRADEFYWGKKVDAYLS